MRNAFRYVACPAFARRGPARSFTQAEPALAFAQLHATRCRCSYVVYVRRPGLPLLLGRRVEALPFAV